MAVASHVGRYGHCFAVSDGNHVALAGVDRHTTYEGNDTDDAEVIARVTAGERDLFRVLVVRYSALAQRTAILCGAGSDADDVVQEAFVSAYTALSRFRTREAFRPWLLRIVVNQAHNTTRAPLEEAASAAANPAGPAPITSTSQCA